MDNRSTAFLEVMIGIAIVCFVAILIVLVAKLARRRDEGAARESEGGYVPRWYELALAALLVVAVAAVLVWQLAPILDQKPDAAGWRGDTRALVFFIIMLVVGGAGLVGFLVMLFVRRPREARQGGAPRQGRVAPPAQPAAEAGGAEPAGAATPSGMRLLGLVLLAAAFLLLNWTYLPRGQQFAVMLYLIYPASLAVALVLLFDKASRAWSVKTPAEEVREWLLCDTIAFLLVLGFVNLLISKAGGKYAAMFWDFVHVVAFFFVFWLLDRKVTRYRFLVGYAYLLLLPILLLIWQVSQAVPTPKGLSWWGTIWPVFFLTVIFFVLEIIALIASRESDKHTVPAVKDALFVLLYGVLLLVAIPGEGG